MSETMPLLSGNAPLDVDALAESAASKIRQAAPNAQPKVAIILGSGLGNLATRLEDAVSISYEDLDGFPKPSVAGHQGRLFLGTLAGVSIACLQGRAHAYEGRGFNVMQIPIVTLRRLGTEILYLTCAAGSLRPEVGPGRLMALSDHLNLQGGNPLTGPNDEQIGPRFPPMETAYDTALLALQHRAAEKVGIDLAQGVYAAFLGPSFETPAEVRMARLLGADAAGMSTVPECILARHCGLRVTATAVITNLGVGMSDTIVDHAQTLSSAKEAGEGLERLFMAFLDLLVAP